MGNCCGGSSVPKVIIPDPENGKEYKVLCKKAGMMSSDFEVFQDCDDKKKWLFIDKKGSIWKDPKYILENYVRDEKKQGKVLASAKIGDANVKVYGHETHEDSDGSDDYSADSGDEADVQTTKMKWAQKLKVKLYSDREMKTQVAEVVVKAKGKAKKIERTVTSTDEEGNESSSTSVDVKKKVKKMIYKLHFMDGKDDCEIHLKGKFNGKESDLVWTCPVFEASTKGFFNPKVTISTKWKDTGFAFLLGFITAAELAPNDIADNVKVW